MIKFKQSTNTSIFKSSHLKVCNGLLKTKMNKHLICNTNMFYCLLTIMFILVPVGCTVYNTLRSLLIESDYFHRYNKDKNSS